MAVAENDKCGPLIFERHGDGPENRLWQVSVYSSLHAGQQVGAVLRLLFGAGVWSVIVWFLVLLVVGFPVAIGLGNMTWTRPAG